MQGSTYAVSVFRWRPVLTYTSVSYSVRLSNRSRRSGLRPPRAIGVTTHGSNRSTDPGLLPKSHATRQPTTRSEVKVVWCTTKFSSMEIISTMCAKYLFRQTFIGDKLALLCGCRSENISHTWAGQGRDTTVGWFVYPNKST